MGTALGRAPRERVQSPCQPPRALCLALESAPQSRVSRDRESVHPSGQRVPWTGEGPLGWGLGLVCPILCALFPEPPVTSPLSRSSVAEADQYHLAWWVLPADLLTPVQAFRALRASGHEGALLESVEGVMRLARYSFVAVDPRARLRARAGSVTMTEGGQETTRRGTALEALRAALKSHAVPKAPPGLPPLVGGWLGFFGHEWVTELEPRIKRPDADPFGTPDASFELFRDVLAFDHATQRLYLITACPRGSSDHGQAQKTLAALAEDLFTDAGDFKGFELLDDGPVHGTSKAAFTEAVDTLRQAIGAGEVFQAVLSQGFSRRFSGDPFTLYRVLRLVNPAPHMFYWSSGGTTLIGSSPERLVSLRDGQCLSVPIAGTRPRGDTPAEDELLGIELMTDPKERSEHDMLVDLARNDLGRVARVGSVRVREHAVLEKFPRVQHLVSRVESRLAAGRDALDLAAACFPAGTVSGAPKVRALELVAELEGRCRGPYAGAFGYFDGSGAAELAITIRTLVVQNDTVHWQAGAGIVWESNPDLEYAETMHKARALAEAVSMAARPAFQPPVAQAQGARP